MEAQDKKDWSFIHAVKTAGQYVNAILISHGFSSSDGHFMGHHDSYKNKKVLICKRNPYDRVNSMFHFYKKRRQLIPYWMTLKDFVMGMYHEEVFKQKWLDKVSYKNLMSPLTTIAKDADGNIQADYILDFHDLDNSLSEFLSKFNIEHTPKDPININDSKKELNLDLWDQEMFDKINQIYSEDFEFFGYDKHNAPIAQ